MEKIKRIKAREILDSRGNPTIEAECELSSGVVVRAAVPSGASKGVHEALELRDQDPQRYRGLGVQKACSIVEHKIAPALKGLDPAELPRIDERICELDGTPNKSELGANSTLAVSLLLAKVGAALREIPLYRHLAGLYGIQELRIPTPMFNFINGGRHANNGISIQEFMIVPETAPNFRDALRQAAEVFSHLKAILAKRQDSSAVGDEGGFAPLKIVNPGEAMDLLLEAARAAGHSKGIGIALDLASTEFYSQGGYKLFSGQPPLDYRQMTKVLGDWVQQYPLLSIEDPLAEDDWEGWTYLSRELPVKVQGSPAGSPLSTKGRLPLLIGDDIFVTNPERLKRGFREKVANAILIKPNQIGTVTETAQVVQIAKEHGYATVASHRSGDSEDAALAHIAVGLGTDGIKAGSVSRSERLAKYNELLRIEEELGENRYRGALHANSTEVIATFSSVLASPSLSVIARSEATKQSQKENPS